MAAQAGGRRLSPDPASRSDGERQVSVAPVVVTTRTFAARPAAWAQARDFVQGALGSAGAGQGTDRAVLDAIGAALLASAGTRRGTFQVTVRLLPEQVEIEVLTDAEPGTRTTTAPLPHDLPESFAEWLADALERAGLSQEQAAVQLGVSVRTIGRWVRGETEPRLRDMRRVSEAFNR